MRMKKKKLKKASVHTGSAYINAKQSMSNSMSITSVYS